MTTKRLVKIRLCAGTALAAALLTNLTQAAGPPPSLDSSFAVNGKMELEIGDDSEAFDLLVQADGRIVLGGLSWKGNTSRFALARVMPDGSLDGSFGNQGLVTTDVSSLSSGVWCLALQQSSTSGPKILAAGYAFDGSKSVIAVARYLESGSLDLSFGNQGVAKLPLATPSAGGRSMVVTPNGSIVVGGYASDPTNASLSHFAVMRLDKDGQVDQTFGQGGSVFHAISNDLSEIRSLKLLNNTILGIGFASYDHGKRSEFAVARYTANGQIDSSFMGGAVSTAFGGYPFAKAVAAQVQTNGKVVAAGWKDVGTTQENFDAALVRYQSDGQLDLNFGQSGKVTLGQPSSKERAVDLVASQAGSLLVIGQRNSRSMVMKLDGTGSLDTSWADKGMFTGALLCAKDNVAKVARAKAQADGKLLVVGSCYAGLNGHFAITRIGGTDGVPEPLPKDPGTTGAGGQGGGPPAAGGTGGANNSYGGEHSGGRYQNPSGDSPPLATPQGSGCGCRTAQDSRGLGSAFPLLVVLAFLLRSRRRRRRPKSPEATTTICQHLRFN